MVVGDLDEVAALDVLLRDVPLDAGIDQYDLGVVVFVVAFAPTQILNEVFDH